MTTLISIKWFTLETSEMVGVVQLYDNAKNEYLGEWNVYVDENTIRHRAKNPNDNLPPICQIESVMKDVENMIHIYMDGYARRDSIHQWLMETPTIPTS